MSELIGILDAAKGSANLVREYALDHYVHFGFLPSDVDVMVMYLTMRHTIT